jgi:hypothetical protein
MRLEDINEFHATRPFVPFALRLADGRSLPVKHPEVLAYAKGQRTVHYLHPDGRAERADVMLIVSINELPNGNRNGKGRKGKGRRAS